MKLARRILHHPGLLGAAALVSLCGIASCRPAVETTVPSAAGGAGSGGATSGVGGTVGGGGSTGSSSTGGVVGGAGSGGNAGNGGNAGSSATTGRGGSGAVTSVGGSGGSGGSSATGGSKATGGSTGTSSTGGGGSGGGGSGGSGGGGSGGNGGSGGASTIPDAAVDTVDAPPPPPSRGPTPATTGHNFPFPQNRENSRCIYPKLYRNEDAQAAYAQWKNDTVTTDGASGFRRVKRPKEPGLEANSTVSEGIAYGMLLAVYMDDQALFDKIWSYEQKWVDAATGLMNWYINAAGSDLGTNPSGIGPATDADEDMAFALVMAGKQWGGKGKLGKNYSDLALETIIKVWNNEIYNYKYLRPGAWGDTSTINLSYFAPAYYKLFAKLDTADPSRNWLAMTDTMYTVLNASLNASNGNASNGLVPAWCDTSGKPNGGAFGPTGGASPTNYQYDSCRMPFRIALDYCWNGDTRAQTYLAKTSSFFGGIGATKMVDGYALNGTPQAQYQTGANATVQSAAFVGPAGVGAMSSSTYQTFVNEAYGVLITGKALVGGTYYDDSWMAMSLLMMTANFLDYTTLTPA